MQYSVCGEVFDSAAADWRKAAASNALGSCVRLAAAPGEHVAFGDSKRPEGIVHFFTRAAAAAFMADIKAGKFDDLV